MFAPDVVFTTFDADGDELTFHGLEETRGWLAGFLKQWSDFRKELLELDLRGDRALAICRQSGAGRTSGLELDMPAYDVWVFDGDRAVELYVTRDEQAARARFNVR